MKLFAWLVGALLGALLLPLFMVLFGQTALYLMSTPPGRTPPPFHPSLLLRGFPEMLEIYAPWGAGLGFCGALLWTGDRSLPWRLLALIVGIGTISYWVWMWAGKQYPRYMTHVNVGFFQKISAAYAAPIIVAAMALVFFALLLRPRNQHREQR